MYRIFILSDGKGKTAEQMVTAVLTQFPKVSVNIEIKPEVLNEQQIDEIMPEVVEAKGMIVHTLVAQHLRDYIVRASRLHNVDALDLMGPLLSRISHHLSTIPMEEPGLYFKLNKEYFKRIDSIQFAFNHDDGQRYYEYEKAEIILVGVSRTFKTPLSVYLAYKNWFVANYPVVLGVEPPVSLNNLPYGNVFGLTTQPMDLSTLRQARHEYLQGNTGEYSSIDFVKKELSYAQSIFAQHQWPIISVTNKPIEEIASEILAIKRRIDQIAYIRKKTE